ncbi:MAG: hypothetical protein GY842_22925 [bacterium]|nr:hypothetical protein [bacterium]
MRSTEHQNGEASPLGTGRRRSNAGALRRCAVVSMLTLSLAGHELRAGHAQFRISDASWVAVPVVAIPIATAPHVSRPTESLGSCDFVQRFLITNVVAVHRGELVALSLFGGLHGP